MDTVFTEEQRLLQQTLREYAREQLRPDYARWDAGEPFPRERVRALGDLGVLGVRVPEAYGGTEGRFVSLGIAAEELARGDFNVTFFLQLGTIAVEILRAHGSPELQEAWLPGLAAGERIVAFALTEPGVGSDAAALTTSARRDGDAFVLKGEKASATFAGFADAALVFARMGGPGVGGIGTILVPLDVPGVSRQVCQSAGERLSQRGSLFFDDVRVPVANQIGDVGTGFLHAMEAFDFNRAIIALACLGAAQESLEETMAYAKERETFGAPLAKRQGVAFQIAEHLTHVAAARLLAYQVLMLRDAGLPHTKEAAMAKWLGPKVAVEALHACVLLNGWGGYGKDLPHEQRLRDVMGLEVGDGTPEIMKAIIAREAFGREYACHR